MRWVNSGNNGGGGSGGGGSGGGGSSSSSSSTKDDCRAIIMAPTRDLAAQIHSWVHKLCKYFNNPPLHASLIVGGNDGHQQRSMDKAHILIGTCGRLKDMLIKNDGSIQKIEGIPQIIRDRYKTAWELKQKHIIDMAADRGKYICQSQSLNLFMEAPNFSKLSSMHFYAWQKGLKTGIYYLRSRPSSKAIQFTIAPETCENCSA